MKSELPPILKTGEEIKFAFPSQIGAVNNYQMGMTLKEYYAGQALQGFFSGIPFDVETPMTEADDKYLDEVARVCFKMADSMLRESQK